MCLKLSDKTSDLIPQIAQKDIKAWKVLILNGAGQILYYYSPFRYHLYMRGAKQFSSLHPPVSSGNDKEVHNGFHSFNNKEDAEALCKEFVRVNIGTGTSFSVEEVIIPSGGMYYTGYSPISLDAVGEYISNSYASDTIIIKEHETAQ